MGRGGKCDLGWAISVSPGGSDIPAKAGWVGVIQAQAVEGSVVGVGEHLLDRGRYYIGLILKSGWLGSNPSSAANQLCDCGQGDWPLHASDSSFINTGLLWGWSKLTYAICLAWWPAHDFKLNRQMKSPSMCKGPGAGNCQVSHETKVYKQAQQTQTKYTLWKCTGCRKGAG